MVGDLEEDYAETVSEEVFRIGCVNIRKTCKFFKYRVYCRICNIIKSLTNPHKERMKTAEQIAKNFEIAFQETTGSKWEIKNGVIAILKQYAEQEVLKHLDLAMSNAKVLLIQGKDEIGSRDEWIDTHDYKYAIDCDSITNIKIDLT